jgi:hypothetical protein
MLGAVRSLVVLVIALSGTGAPGLARAGGDAGSCLAALDELGVEYRKAKRRGIEIGVEVRGPLGGVEYRSYNRDPLILDCSLVFSLARAGDIFRAHGVERVNYSSAYQRRNIRGTSRPSRHSFGLAIDVHTLALAGGERFATVKHDYEQGLGDSWDCVGEPLTELGAMMRAVDCQLTGSGLFRILLSPDYDADHYNHFHLEALPWGERADRDPRAPLTSAWAAGESTRRPDLR